MTEMNHQSPLSASSIVRFWGRIPIVVRAIVVGFLVSCDRGFRRLDGDLESHSGDIKGLL